jgi:hypothetical protein
MLLARYHRLATGFFWLEIAAALLVLVVTARLLLERREVAPGPAPPPRPAPKILNL